LLFTLVFIGFVGYEQMRNQKRSYNIIQLPEMIGGVPKGIRMRQRRINPCCPAWKAGCHNGEDAVKLEERLWAPPISLILS
jgi:hypothetical protein